MIPTYHDHGQLSPELGEGSGHVEPAARDHAGVGEPEIEEVAVDEQAIAQCGHYLEEPKQSFLGPSRRDAEVGIRDDNERVAQHGAKDGLSRPLRATGSIDGPNKR
jgi:hypothetical protein